MRKELRKNSREILKGRYGKLFMLTVLSVFARFLLIFAGLALIVMLFSPESREYTVSLAGEYGAAAIYAAVGMLAVLMFFVSAGIRLGENAVYASAAAGNRKSGLALFIHCTPVRSARAFVLYLTLAARKLMWTAALLLPGAALGAATIQLYRNGLLSEQTLVIFCTGTAALIIVALCFLPSFLLRYDFCTLLCSHSINTAPGVCVSVGVSMCEGARISPLFMRLMMLPRLISCVLIFPAVYAVPYYKLCRALNFQKVVTADEKYAKMP